MLSTVLFVFLCRKRYMRICICCILTSPTAFRSSLNPGSIKLQEYEDLFLFKKFRVPHTVIIKVFSVNWESTLQQKINLYSRALMEINSSSGNLEILCLLMHLTIHTHIDENPLFFFVRSQMNPVHASLSPILKFSSHLNPWVSRGVLSFHQISPPKSCNLSTKIT